MRLPRKIKQICSTSATSLPNMRTKQKSTRARKRSLLWRLYASQVNPAHAGFIDLTKWSDKDSTSSHAALAQLEFNLPLPLLYNPSFSLFVAASRFYRVGASIVLYDDGRVVNIQCYLNTSFFFWSLWFFFILDAYNRLSVHNPALCSMCFPQLFIKWSNRLSIPKMANHMPVFFVSFC